MLFFWKGATFAVCRLVRVLGTSRERSCVSKYLGSFIGASAHLKRARAMHWQEGLLNEDKEKTLPTHISNSVQTACMDDVQTS